VHDIAFILAREADLNDAVVWINRSEKALQGTTFPQPILIVKGDLAVMNPDFPKLPLAFEIASNIPLDARAATTPIAWTRGLQRDGTWAEDSISSRKGGVIAFLDGHVEWCNEINANPESPELVRYNTNIPTKDIRDALPPGAVILSAEPKK